METITNIKNPKGKIKILEVNFNLKSKKDKNKKVLILVVYRHKGEKLVYSTRHKIEPKYWDDKKQKPKISYTLYKSINNDLEQIKNYINEILNSNPEINISDLKKQLDIKLNRIIEPEKTNPDNFIHYFQKHIKNMFEIEYDHKYNYRTIQKFKTVLVNLFKYKGHNIDFSEILNYKNIEFPFDEIDLEFKEKYMKFRYENTGAKSQNTLNTDIVIISKILENSYIDQLHKNTIFQNEKFKISRVDTSKLALTEEDLEILSNFDFTFNIRMERVIDWFLISCYTALRWSDFSKIEPEHIIKDNDEYYLRILTYKTRKDVYIPIDHKFLNLIKKYDYKSIDITNQEFNRVLKKALEYAGLTKEIFINENIKGESKEVKYRICDIISAHDGRRTWATINYIKGYPIGLLMQVTGHTKEETFLKYVNASNLQKAKKLKELMNK